MEKIIDKEKRESNLNIGGGRVCFTEGSIETGYRVSSKTPVPYMLHIGG